mgnify:CR=1
IKSQDTYAGSTSTFWETYKISTAGVLDWSSGTYSASIGKKESLFGQDLDGGGIWSLDSVTLHNVSISGTQTDTSISGN